MAPPASLGALQRRAERAEARATALAAENKQLRSERTRAVLAAAHAQKAIAATCPPSAAPQQPLDALAGSIKPAEEALRNVEQEREKAVRVAEEALHEEYARRIEAIRLQHSGEIAAQAESAEKRAAEKVEDRIATLTDALAGAEAALRAVVRECEAAAHAAEATARAEFERRIDTLRSAHADELEAQARAAQTKFAEEIMTALATAQETWKKETEKRLGEAKEDGLKAIARAEANWRRRHKVTLWRAARLWRMRERGRLVASKRGWQSLHRQALDAGNRRWQVRLDRVKRRARRSVWPAASVQRVRTRVAAFAEARLTVRPPESSEVGGAKPSAAPLGAMAIALIVVAVHFSPAAPFPDAVPETMGTASAQAMSREQIPAPTLDRRDEARPAEGAARSLPSKPAEAATALPEEHDKAPLSDAELRRRLQERIRRIGGLTTADNFNLGEPFWQDSDRAAASQGRTASGGYSEAVADIQRDLKRLGYDPGPVDGVLGPRTKAAGARFEGDQGIGSVAEESDRPATTAPKRASN
jgi:hypothetical protein